MHYILTFLTSLQVIGYLKHPHFQFYFSDHYRQLNVRQNVRMKIVFSHQQVFAYAEDIIKKKKERKIKNQM